MKKILWFSRHKMTPEQHQALVSKHGQIEVTQINGSPANVHVSFEGSVNGGEVSQLPPFKELAKDYDVLAVVLPINLQQQVLQVAENKPVIQALNNRNTVPDPNGGEAKVVFTFAKWQRIEKIEVVLSDY
jgi:hypothetical protein